MELAKEDFEEGKRGLLRNATCGTSGAAQNWEMENTEMMVEAASNKGRTVRAPSTAMGSTRELLCAEMTLRRSDPVRVGLFPRLCTKWK